MRELLEHLNQMYNRSCHLAASGPLQPGGEQQFGLAVVLKLAEAAELPAAVRGGDVGPLLAAPEQQVRL